MSAILSASLRKTRRHCWPELFSVILVEEQCFEIVVSANHAKSAQNENS
jgi:ribosomal protein L28